MPNLLFTDASGKQSEATLDVTDYKEASEKKLSLSQHYAMKYPTKQGQASAFEQFCAASGIRLRADKETGIPATTMREVLYGGTDKYAGTIVRPDGSDRGGIAGRLLYPEVMIQLIESALLEDKEDYLQPWEAAVALRTSVTSPRVDQPLITTTAPEGSAAQPIAQLAEPSVMVSISLSERSFNIPTKSIGLQIADQALEAATLDLVGITLASQARGERIRRIEEDMGKIISGDVDFGINAVTFALASTFTTETIDAATPITQRVWVKWLRENYQKMTVTHVLCDIDALLDVENRANRPTVFNDTSLQGNLLNPNYTVENAGLPTPRVLLLPTSIVGADSLVGFDSRNALHEITNISASYSAIEQFVLRRSTAMRFDFGIALFKLYDDAFTGLTIGS